MDLTTSRAFQCHRADVLSLVENDVVPVGKVESDTLWHGVSVYIGVNLRCKKCSAEFSFTAHEQKAWREDYGFSIHSYPVHCRACRASEREVAVLRKRLCSVLSKNTFAQKDFDELIDVVYALIKKARMDVIGYRLKQKIYWAAKRSLHPRTEEVVRTIKNENHGA